MDHKNGDRLWYETLGNLNRSANIINKGDWLSSGVIYQLILITRITIRRKPVVGITVTGLSILGLLILEIWVTGRGGDTCPTGKFIRVFEILFQIILPGTGSLVSMAMEG